MTAGAGRAAARATTRAFDRLAPEYDALAAGEIFQLLRRRTHNAFAALLRPRDRGCSRSGAARASTRRFSRPRSVRSSPAIRRRRWSAASLRRLAHAGLESRATVLPCGLQDLASFLDALATPDGFDGIVSNFGALNCVEHLAPLGALARDVPAAGGVVLLGLMGRTCARRSVVFHGDRDGRTLRRRRHVGAVAVPVAGIDVPTFYHRIADVRAALGPRDACCSRSKESAWPFRRRTSSRDGSSCRARCAVW